MPVAMPVVVARVWLSIVLCFHFCPPLTQKYVAGRECRELPAVTGSVLALCTGYRLCVLVTGSVYWLPALCTGYRLCVLVTGSVYWLPALCTGYRLCVLVTGSVYWLLFILLKRSQRYHRQQNTCYLQRCLLAHFEATLDFSRSKFTCP